MIFESFNSKQSCDEKLKMMLGGLSQRYLRDATIVLGDFNRPREEVTDLLADSNIHPAPRPLAPNQQPQHQTWYTRFERRL